MLLALALQASLLSRPLYLDEAPPELRAGRSILIVHEGVPGAPEGTRDLPTAQKLAEQLVGELREGADFGALAQRYDESPNRPTGSQLGAQPRGVLAPELDAFLFAAQIGDVSAPLETARGLQILERVPAYAEVRQVLIQGERAEARARALVERARAGEDFTALVEAARAEGEVSPHATGETILVRGWHDKLVKALAFETPIGELAEPLQSPLGWHVVQRLPRGTLPAEALERVFVRARAVLIAWSGATAAAPDLDRPKERAFELAQQIYGYVTERGDPLERYAKQWNDDPGGRERFGDLGWIYRNNPDSPAFLRDLFTKPIGELAPPFETTAGYVLMRRER